MRRGRRRVATEAPRTVRSSLRFRVLAMAGPRDPSHPPSDPRPLLGRGGFARLSPERPFRAEITGALVLGLLLVASGLYVWRRPHKTADPAPDEALPTPLVAAPAASGLPAASSSPGRPAPVTLTNARILACHDLGPKKTPSDQCDHLATVEKALADAVEQSATCISPTSPPAPASGGVGGATIEYVADVSFLRHKVSILLPRAGRSVHDRKVLAACGAAVREVMGSLPLDSVDHQHARYRIAVTATYRGSAGGV